MSCIKVICSLEKGYNSNSRDKVIKARITHIDKEEDTYNMSPLGSNLTRLLSRDLFKLNFINNSMLGNLSKTNQHILEKSEHLAS